MLINLLGLLVYFTMELWGMSRISDRVSLVDCYCLKFSLMLYYPTKYIYSNNIGDPLFFVIVLSSD